MMSCPNSKTSVFTVAFFDILSLNLSLVGVCREVRQTGIQARHPCDDVVPLGYAHVFGTPPVSPALLYLLMQANIYSNSGKREVHFRIAEIEKCRDVFRNLKTENCLKNKRWKPNAHHKTSVNASGIWPILGYFNT
jgi:hypothetical protein